MSSHREEQNRIGVILLLEHLDSKGLFNEEQRYEILKHSAEKGIRFGEAALDLNYDRHHSDLVRKLGNRFKHDFFHLSPECFPESTKDLLTLEQIIKWGALPLGAKARPSLFGIKKIINIGLLDPDQKKYITAVEDAVRSQYQIKAVSKVRFFLVLAEQFVQILQEVYQVSGNEFEGYREKGISPVLETYIDQSSALMKLVEDLELKGYPPKKVPKKVL